MFKRKVIVFSVIAAILLFAASWTADFLNSKYVLPILMYHSIDSKVDPVMRLLIVSPGTFEKQMRFLKEHKYNVLPLASMIKLAKERKNIPQRAVVITLDDGYKNNYVNAYPILKKYNFPATIFIIINEINRPDRLSWEEVKEMQLSGLISFGSHTLGATPLIDINSEEERKRQVFESKKILEEKLGEPVISFSYPEGRFNDKIVQLVKDAGYALAVATSPGKRFKNNDPFLLKRLRISENSANLFIFGFETSGYYTFLKELRKK